MTDNADILMSENLVDDSQFPIIHSDLSPLVMAHIGDAYYHLFVRVKLINYKHKVNDLHEISAKIVSAVSQSKSYLTIENQLTEEERYIFRRGRNTKSRSSHSATQSVYHNSTGFEALLGALFLEKKFARLNEIADAAFNVIMGEINEQ